MFVHVFAGTLYAQRSFRKLMFASTPPNIKMTPSSSSYAMAAPRRGVGAAGGSIRFQLYIGFTWSWIAAAGPEPMTSVAKKSPPAKSSSVVHVLERAAAGSEIETKNPVARTDATRRSATNRRLV